MQVPPTSPTAWNPMMPRSIDDDATLAAAIEAVARLDPHAVAHLVEIGGRPAPRRRAVGFEGLAEIVVAQQVSTASAAAVFDRLSLAVVPLEADVLARTPDETLRGCGLSIQKIQALRSIADALIGGTLRLDRLVTMPVDDALRALIAIKGIGPWTAQVFLLFCIGHADAWPAGDLALQEATRLLLRLDERPDAAALTAIAERWRPHRGAIAYLLWGYYRATKRRDAGVPGADPA